ncbi:MAG: flagellar biosynthetic protein FliO [Methylomonas sp.]
MVPSVVARAEEGMAAVSSRQSGKIISSDDVMQWTLALLLVLAIFFLAAWLLKKSGGLALLGNRQLAIVAGLSLGMREKLVLVKVGEKQLLLGVTAGRIDKLLELEGEHRLFQNQAEQVESGLFAKKLMQVMQGKGDG